MARITSDCGAMRLPEHRMALIASGCAPRQTQAEKKAAAKAQAAVADEAAEEAAKMMGRRKQVSPGTQTQETSLGVFV